MNSRAVAARMTDPSAAERLAALRSTRDAPKVHHAQAAKILTAGLSTSMVLGIVSYMAHSANVQEAAQARAARREANSQLVADKVAKAVALTPSTTATSSGGSIVAAGGAPVAPAPRVVVVPVPQPAKPSATPSGQQAPSKPATTSRSSK
jgi:hypothetical protein